MEWDDRLLLRVDLGCVVCARERDCEIAVVCSNRHRVCRVRFPAPRRPPCPKRIGPPPLPSRGSRPTGTLGACSSGSVPSPGACTILRVRSYGRPVGRNLEG